MVDWRSLRHAYAEASNVPALIDQLAAQPTEAVWQDIWSCLCHQGTVYPASYAALPLLLNVTSKLPSRERPMALSLIGSIIASDDRVGVASRPLELIEPLLPPLKRMAEASMRSACLERNEFIYLLEAASAFEGDFYWGRHLDHLAGGEFPGLCRVCRHELYLVIGEHGFFTSAEEWATSRNAGSRRTAINPAKSSWLSGTAAWLHNEAARHGQLEVADWLRHLFGTTECPACGSFLDVEGAVAAVFPGK